MRKVKYIFFAYVALVVLIVAGIAASFVATPPRDPDPYYTVYTANLKTLDPAEIDDTESASVVGNIFETLYNYRYGVKPYTLFPQLAAAMPEVSADGKTWTIKLRRGIHFYDPWKKVFPDGVGPEITARDFIYSWKRIANFQLGNTANYGAMFEGKIEGLDDWWAYTKAAPRGGIDWDRPVSGWTALDDYTIRIKLLQPYPQLRYNLAHEPTSVVCRQAVEKLGDDFKKYPIGSGPFAMAEHLPEQRVTLTANPIYRGKPDVDGSAIVPPAERLPRVKRIQVDYFAEQMPAWLLFRQGYFDVAAIPRDAFDKAVSGPTGELTPEMERDGVRLRKSQVAEIYYVGFNMLDPVVGKNLPLRQAMSMALDRAQYIKIELNGRGLPATGVVPPGFPTYDPARVDPYTVFNLEAARKLVAEAQEVNRKLNGGPIPQLKLHIGDTSTISRQNGDFFVEQMKRIGLDVRYELTTFAHFQELVDSKQAQMFAFGWVADYPDEQTFLQLFYGKNTGPGGVNSFGYVNAEYDRMYEKAVVLEPGAERDALYRKLQDIVNADCPALFLCYPIAYGLYYDWVHGTQPMEYGNGQMMSWMYLSIDSAARLAWHKKHR